jgi:hypothetical protein
MDSSADDVAARTVAVPSEGWEDLWPPVSYAENDHILVWWLPDYDEVLRQLMAEYQWAWRGGVLERLEPLIPDGVLSAWRDSDPQCQESSWYNVLGTFAAARAKQLGIVPRPAEQKMCSCCSRQFLESDLSYRFIGRIGVSSIDVCDVCLGKAFYDKGSSASSSEDVIAVLQALSGVLGRPPKTTDLTGRLILRDLTHDGRVTAIAALHVKPTPARIKELFGSLKDAVAQAATASPIPLPLYRDPPLHAPEGSEFTSRDPAVYQSLIGPLPAVTLDTGRGEAEYYEEVRSLIGTGYLALAEAALTELPRHFRVMNFNGLLAEIYSQTARYTGIRTESDLRDVRTITARPVFYEPLRSLPRGNVCFILVGGPMEFVDRRGEHACASGEGPHGDAAAGIAESIARMSAMVDGEPWMRAATETGQAILASLARSGDVSSLSGHLVSYMASPFREIVKELTGSLPAKVSEESWTPTPAGKSRWSYQREAGRYIFNASAGYTLMTVETSPTVCIWGWPDRSDSCLQAFLDTVACARPGPVFAILPDVPAYRDFARRYARREPMTRSGRALIEDLLYRFPPDMVNKRGSVLSAEFAPRLVIYPDGGEDDGAVLAGAIAYLDAHHTLRLSVWDVLRDDLLRETALAACPPPGTFSVTAADRTDTVRWYAQYSEYDDPGILFRPYRPTLLDAVTVT